MADNDNGDEEREEPSFRERLEAAREGEGEEAPEDPFGGGMGGGPGMGGNPFAQMMGGMMGGGGPGGRMQEEARETAVAKEVAQLREELESTNDHLERIADALEEN